MLLQIKLNNKIVNEIPSNRYLRQTEQEKLS